MLNAKEITKKMVSEYDTDFFEEFEIVRDGKEDKDYVYRFALDRLQKKKIGEDELKYADASKEYCELLRRECKIKKIPFVPKKGQKYYFVCWNNMNTKAYATHEIWEGCLFDYLNLRTGNVFKTILGAQNRVKEVSEKIKYGKC